MTSLIEQQNKQESLLSTEVTNFLLHSVSPSVISKAITRIGIEDSSSLIEYLKGPLLRNIVEEQLFKIAENKSHIETLFDFHEALRWIETWLEISDEFMCDRLQELGLSFTSMLFSSMCNISYRVEFSSIDDELLENEVYHSTDYQDNKDENDEPWHTIDGVFEVTNKHFISVDDWEICRKALTALSETDSDFLSRVLEICSVNSNSSLSSDILDERSHNRSKKGFVATEKAKEALQIAKVSEKWNIQISELLEGIIIQCNTPTELISFNENESILKSITHEESKPKQTFHLNDPIIQNKINEICNIIGLKNEQKTLISGNEANDQRSSYNHSNTWTTKKVRETLENIFKHDIDNLNRRLSILANTVKSYPISGQFEYNDADIISIVMGYIWIGIEICFAEYRISRTEIQTIHESYLDTFHLDKKAISNITVDKLFQIGWSISHKSIYLVAYNLDKLVASKSPDYMLLNEIWKKHILHSKDKTKQKPFHTLFKEGKNSVILSNIDLIEECLPSHVTYCFRQLFSSLPLFPTPLITLNFSSKSEQSWEYINSMRNIDQIISFSSILNRVI